MNEHIEKLREIIDKSDMTKAQIAHATGTGDVTIYQWLNYARGPTLFLFACTLDVLGYKIKIVRKEDDK